MSDLFRAELITLLPRLRRFALGLTANPDRADDLVQAACERALTRRQQWEAGTRLDSWLFKIIQNLWFDQLRIRSGTVHVDMEEIENLPDRDWNAKMEAQLTLEQTLHAMQQLPPLMRNVLTLVCIEDLSYKDAADVLGVPIGTVMSRLARARIELNRQLQAGAIMTAETKNEHAPLH